MVGHSLGSLILFDLLSGQTTEEKEVEASLESSPLVKPKWDKDLDIGEVFVKLGIEEHLAPFTDQGVGVEELLECGEEDLKENRLLDFKPLLSDPKHSDIVLKCGGTRFLCHKVILTVR